MALEAKLERSKNISSVRSPIGQTGRAALLLSRGLGRRWLRQSLLGALAEPDAALFGEGAALAPEARTRLERLLGRDLSGVRTFSGERVQEMGTALAAEAFTVGASVFLTRPADGDNLPLLAHELTHVVQQQHPPLIPAGLPPRELPEARPEPSGEPAAVVGADVQAGIVPHLPLTLLDATTLEQAPARPQLSPEVPADTDEGAETQARANEAAAARPAAPRGSGPVDAAAVADSVYRLMRDDLLIERERHAAIHR